MSTTNRTKINSDLPTEKEKKSESTGIKNKNKKNYKNNGYAAEVFLLICSSKS